MSVSAQLMLLTEQEVLLNVKLAAYLLKKKMPFELRHSQCIFYLFFVFLPFLGPLSRRMEVPGLGV